MDDDDDLVIVVKKNPFFFSIREVGSDLLLLLKLSECVYMRLKFDGDGRK